MRIGNKDLYLGIEFFDNLQGCLKQSGGRGISLEELQGMSALEFLLHIAPNNIKFIYQPPIIPPTEEE